MTLSKKLLSIINSSSSCGSIFSDRCAIDLSASFNLGISQYERKSSTAFVSDGVSAITREILVGRDIK